MIHFHPFIWVHQLCLRYQIFTFSDLTSPLMSVGKGISHALQRVLPCELVVFIELGSSYILMLFSTCIRQLYVHGVLLSHLGWSALAIIYLYYIVCRSVLLILVGEELGLSLQPLSHRRSITSLCLFYRYFHGKCATSVSDLVPPVRVFERETRLSACSHLYTLALPRCRTKSYSNSFFPRTASLWNSLAWYMFPSILQSILF